VTDPVLSAQCLYTISIQPPVTEETMESGINPGNG